MNFFTLKVADHQNRVPREVVESASLDMCPSHTDTFLCALDDPALAGEWTRWSPEAPFQP